MRKIVRFKKLTQGEFLNGFLMISSSNIIAQIIPFIIMPLLTRLYTPEEFGVFAFLMSIIALLSVIASGKYELAILVVESKKEREELLTLCFGLLISFVFLIFCVILIYEFIVMILIQEFTVNFILFLVPLLVFFIVTHNILFNFSNAKGEYKKIAMNSITHALLNNFLAVALSVLSGFGLLISFLCSRVVTNFRMLEKKKWLKLYKSLTVLHTRKKEYLKLVRKYKKFPLYSVPSEGMDIYIKQAPILLLNFFSGLQVVGLFALTDRVLTKPLTVIGKAISVPF